MSVYIEDTETIRAGMSRGVGGSRAGPTWSAGWPAGRCGRAQAGQGLGPRIQPVQGRGPTWCGDGGGE